MNVPITFVSSALRGSFFLVIAALSVQCASYTQETKKIRSEYRFNNYDEALSELEGSSLKDSSRNRLLYLLEKSSILEKMGQGDKARKLLIQADKLVDELYTVSLSKEAATYLFNESAQAYPGEDYEKVAIHTSMALSFLNDKSLAEARVEAKRINTRLNEINSKYEKKNRYSEDAFGRYLAGMIYEARGEWDSAIIDYRNALKAYDAGYSRLFQTSAPRSLIESLYGLLLKRRRQSLASQMLKEYRWLKSYRPSSRTGDVIVIHPIGNIAIKKQIEHVIPFGRQIVRFSFPVIQARRRYSAGKTGVKPQNQPFQSAAVSQDFDRIASATLEDRRLRIIAKAGARLILKGQMTQEAEKRGGPLLGLIFNIYGAVSETADTRQWSLLPSRYYVTRVSLPEGKQNLKVYSDGKLRQMEQVHVKAGRLSILLAE